MLMNCQSTLEQELSTALYRLIGDLNAEVSLLPTWRTVERWSRREVFTAVIRCKDAMVDAQKCAIRLSRLDDIDAYSASWIDEIIERCDEYQDLLSFVEDELVNHAS
jgi:ABC-type transporter Mla MlaB component